MPKLLPPTQLERGWGPGEWTQPCLPRLVTGSPCSPRAASEGLSSLCQPALALAPQPPEGSGS